MTWLVFNTPAGRTAVSRAACIEALEACLPGAWDESEAVPGGDREGDLGRWYAGERGWSYEGVEAPGVRLSGWVSEVEEAAHLARACPMTAERLRDVLASPTTRTYTPIDRSAPIEAQPLQNDHPDRFPLSDDETRARVRRWLRGCTTEPSKIRHRCRTKKS